LLAISVVSVQKTDLPAKCEQGPVTWRISQRLPLSPSADTQMGLPLNSAGEQQSARLPRKHGILKHLLARPGP